MKFNRNLFYVLLLIFCVALGVIAVADASSIYSRIGTGMMTGSFIGMVSALVNYMHQRSEYFNKFAMLCWMMAKKMLYYRNEAKMYNLMIESKTKEEMVAYAKETKATEDAETEQMKNEFETLANECQGDLYVPFFFVNSYYSVFESLCLKIRNDLPNLYTYRSLGRDFALVDAKSMGKPEQEWSENDKENYEESCRLNIDYYDLIVFESYSLSRLIIAFCNPLLKRTLSTTTVATLLASARILRKGIRPNDVRDVHAERSKAIESTCLHDEDLLELV